MPYLIMAVLVFAAVSWLRQQLGLTWPQFGVLAVGVPIVLALLGIAFSRRGRRAPGGVPQATINPLPVTPTGRTRAMPENVVIRHVPSNPIMLRYKDANGDLTERVILPKSLHRTLGQDGALLRPRVTAYCTDRKAMRTFVVSRMQQIVDAETGEVIEPIGQYFGVDQA